MRDGLPEEVAGNSVNAAPSASSSSLAGETGEIGPFSLFRSDIFDTLPVVSIGLDGSCAELLGAGVRSALERRNVEALMKPSVDAFGLVVLLFVGGRKKPRIDFCWLFEPWVDVELFFGAFGVAISLPSMPRAILTA